MRRTGRAAAGLSALVMAGCCSTRDLPPAALEIPASLTAPCLHDADPKTVGELKLAYADARLTIAECDARLKAIREAVKP